ncbi:hypothetical protein DINM_007070 [Dirofilaria immitis]|nr:hypothetical protein [Dirofilaria immitis]
MQQLNASNLIDDIIGINSFQRQLECCGVEGSHEWLSLYSGTFEHHKMTKYDLWWSNSWLPKRFTSSCCSAKTFYAQFIKKSKITLQQQQKDASNNKDDYLPKIKEEIIEEERNK